MAVTTQTAPIKAGVEPLPAAAGEPRIMRVPLEAPWQWLAAGWRDLWRYPALSLTYGGVFTVLALAMLHGLTWFGWQSLFLALGGGFLLAAPLLAIGLYEKSRRLQAGEPVDFRDVMFVGARSAGQLGLIGVALLVAYLVWIEIAMVLFALFFGPGNLPTFEAFIPALLFTRHGLGLLITGTTIGAAIAASVFVLTAFSIPLLLVQRTDAVSAMRTSLRAVAHNPWACALWAAIIVVAMSGGVVTFVGLAISFPLIGHATWHAFAALVRPEAELEIVPDVLKR